MIGSGSSELDDPCELGVGEPCALGVGEPCELGCRPDDACAVDVDACAVDVDVTVLLINSLQKNLSIFSFCQ